MRADQAYAELIRLAREESVLSSCADLLEWDEETFMPRAGGDHRAEQQMVLAGLVHDRGIDPRVGELLGQVEASGLVADPEGAVAVNVRELRRQYERERRLPRTLVAESARAATLASQAWVEAREANEFDRFAPWLSRIIELAREEADAVGFPEQRYDALLEDYEPGLTGAQVASLLTRLGEALVPRVAAWAEPPEAPAHVLRREFPIDRQRVFGETVAAAVGFDLERGRIDVAHHPFCTVIGPGDVRIAVRHHRRNFAHGLMVLLHEVGHALYDQGFEASHFGTPMGSAPSLGMHESQSRLWENQVGRSRGFWRHFYPRVRTLFHEALHDVTEDTFLQVINRVAPGVNRGRADEVSYNLHIAIRVELEMALISGTLPVADLPGAWREAYQRHLGVWPKDDREGCLQDGHWAEGMIGYFPTYALGNIYAAQLFDQAVADLGDLEEAFGRGDFGGLLRWLRDRIHQHGSRYSARELILRVTGHPPDPGALLRSFDRRYGGGVVASP